MSCNYRAFNLNKVKTLWNATPTIIAVNTLEQSHKSRVTTIIVVN